MRNRNTIGFDRRLNIEWLDASAARAAAGDDTDAARAYLERVLTGVVDGKGKRGSRAKTVTVLLGVWHRVPPVAARARAKLLSFITEGDPKDRVAGHWAMCMLSYPFYADVATIVGRLLALQGDLTWGQVRRRVRERWGDRPTAERAARRIVRSWVQWGILKDTGTHGSFRLARTPLAVHATPAEVLIEAVLVHSGRDAMPIQDVVASPAVFPFQLGAVIPLIRRSETFEFHRHGGGESVAVASSGTP